MKIDFNLRFEMEDFFFHKYWDLSDRNYILQLRFCYICSVFYSNAIT